MAAVEARERAPELRVVVMEKAHVYRSGCLAAGISALNAYLHQGETPESFLRYVVRDTVGIVRDDLTLTMAAELNEQVRRVESWGLPIPKDERGRPLKRGRGSIKIFGERIKPILGKQAEASGATILNRVNATALDRARRSRRGRVRRSARATRACYAVRAKCVLMCTGGAAGLYRPSNPGMAQPSHVVLAVQHRCRPGDGHSRRRGDDLVRVSLHPAAREGRDRADRRDRAVARRPQINALGEEYLDKHYAHLGGSSMTTQDRLYATMLEKRAGRGPCYLDVRGVSRKRLEGTIAAYSVDGARGRDDHERRGVLRAQGGEMAPVEITGGEPHVVGGHGLSGYWIDNRRGAPPCPACGRRATSPAARRRSTRRARGPKPCSPCAT